MTIQTCEKPRVTIKADILVDPVKIWPCILPCHTTTFRSELYALGQCLKDYTLTDLSRVGPSGLFWAFERSCVLILATVAGLALQWNHWVRMRQGPFWTRWDLEGQRSMLHGTTGQSWVDPSAALALVLTVARGLSLMPLSAKRRFKSV